MKVLHIVRSLETGGAERFVLDLAAYQRDGGPVTPFILELISTTAPRYPALSGVPCTCAGLAGHSLRPASVFRLARMLRHLAPDLAHIHNTMALNHAWLGCLFARVPMVFTKHGSFFVPGLLGRLYRLPRHIICVSTEVHDRLLARHPTTRAKASIISNGIDLLPAGTSRTRAELGLSDGDLLFLWVGRMCAEKALPGLVEAVAGLRTRSAMDGVRFVLIGTGPDAASLRHMVSARGLDDVFVFLGFREDVRELLPLFDVFLLPSATEGAPISLLEAASAGLPAVASRVGAIPDCVIDGESGWLVAPGSVSDLTERLSGVIGRDRRELRQMGFCARQHIREHFSMAACAEAHVRVYEQAMRT